MVMECRGMVLGSGFLALISDMLKENLELNEVIFTTILSACSQWERLEVFQFVVPGL